MTTSVHPYSLEANELVGSVPRKLLPSSLFTPLSPISPLLTPLLPALLLNPRLSFTLFLFLVPSFFAGFRERGNNNNNNNNNDDDDEDDDCNKTGWGPGLKNTPTSPIIT